MFKKMSQFFKNVASEMKKVRWPTKQELVKYTITVVVTVAFVTLFFVVVDFGISSLLKLITG
ncbi:preprotein translocase subunit SecE [Pueribacillus sp. YX66]|uniref:preprotein translocase subunit SecE n=1 Tax=Pueribacillus sp. YX66 TaxID=3229242 RepID=UPI00358D9392